LLLHEGGASDDLQALTIDTAQLQVGRFCHLLTTGARKWIDNRLVKWESEQAAFAGRGYGEPPPPKHPLIQGLAAFRAWVNGGQFTAAALDIVDAAIAVNAFEPAWRGKERWLASRLQDERNCAQALFEMRSGLYLRQLGHDVTYVSPREQSGADLALGPGDACAAVECLQTSIGGGQRVGGATAELVIDRLLRHLDGADRNRVLFLTCARRLEPSDVDAIVNAVKQLTESAENGPVDVVGAKYRVEMAFGGAPFAPLTWPTAAGLLTRLESVRFRRARVDGTTSGVRPPEGTYTMRGVSVASAVPDDAISHLVDAAIDKGDQLSSGKSGLVVAGFGELLNEDQARWRRLNRALSHLVSRRLANHPEISAIAFLFRVEPRRGHGELGPYLQPRSVVHWFRNNFAGQPLPDEFRWAATEDTLVDEPRD